MLSKAIRHANCNLTNEYPQFYHVKKSMSKIVVQKGRRANTDNLSVIWSIDDQHRNTNMNNKDHLGHLTKARSTS